MRLGPVFLALLACGFSTARADDIRSAVVDTRSDLIGLWKLDTKATKADLAKDARFTDTPVDAALETLAPLTLEITADGKITQSLGDFTHPGSYRVVNVQGKVITLEVALEGTTSTFEVTTGGDKLVLKAKLPPNVAAKLPLRFERTTTSAQALARQPKTLPKTKGDARLVGHWKLDMAAVRAEMAETPPFKNMSEKARQKALDADESMRGLAEASALVTADGKLVLAISKAMKFDGTYAVQSVNGSVFIVETRLTSGRSPKVDTVKVSVEGAKMTVILPGGEKLLLMK